MQHEINRPGEIKWHLMVASCYRRAGDYTAALEKYKWIHQHFPDDTDCKTIRVFLSREELDSYYLNRLIFVDICRIIGFILR